LFFKFVEITFTFEAFKEFMPGGDDSVEPSPRAFFTEFRKLIF